MKFEAESVMFELGMDTEEVLLKMPVAIDEVLAQAGPIHQFVAVKSLGLKVVMRDELTS